MNMFTTWTTTTKCIHTAHTYTFSTGANEKNGLVAVVNVIRLTRLVTNKPNRTKPDPGACHMTLLATQIYMACGTSHTSLQPTQTLKNAGSLINQRRRRWLIIEPTFQIFLVTISSQIACDFA